MRDASGSVVRTRIMGRPAPALRGPEAVRFFYDERNVHRHRAIPEPVLGTLFGHEAVHTLDGAAHRARKELFLPLLEPTAVAGLAEHVSDAWDEAVPEWGRRASVVLVDARPPCSRGASTAGRACRWTTPRRGRPRGT
ncbi:hypothetical protein [Streptomyces variabilis]